jgi:hypothetical protein
MASKNTPNVVKGDLIIINELSKHLKYSVEERKFLKRLAKKGVVAVETMLEEAISKVGKVKRSNKDGEDFVNGADAKKAIVNFRSHGPVRSHSREAGVCNLKSKKGNLQVMIAEPESGELFYFVIPHNEYKNQSSIVFQFNKNGGANTDFNGTKSQSWRIWNQYRVSTFKEFAKS